MPVTINMSIFILSANVKHLLENVLKNDYEDNCL